MLPILTEITNITEQVTLQNQQLANILAYFKHTPSSKCDFRTGQEDTNNDGYVFKQMRKTEKNRIKECKLSSKKNNKVIGQTHCEKRNNRNQSQQSESIDMNEYTAEIEVQGRPNNRSSHSQYNGDFSKGQDTLFQQSNDTHSQFQISSKQNLSQQLQVQSQQNQNTQGQQDEQQEDQQESWNSKIKIIQDYKDKQIQSEPKKKEVVKKNNNRKCKERQPKIRFKQMQKQKQYCDISKQQEINKCKKKGRYNLKIVTKNHANYYDQQAKTRRNKPALDRKRSMQYLTLGSPSASNIGRKGMGQLNYKFRGKMESGCYYSQIGQSRIQTKSKQALVNIESCANICIHNYNCEPASENAFKQANWRPKQKQLRIGYNASSHKNYQRSVYIEDNLSKKGETQDCKNSKVSKMSSGSVKINRNPMGKHTDSINENHSYGIRHDSCFLATIHKTKNSNFPYTSLNEEFINIGTLDRKDTKCLINNMKTPKSRPKSLSKPSTSDTNIKFIDQKLNDGQCKMNKWSDPCNELKKGSFGKQNKVCWLKKDDDIENENKSNGCNFSKYYNRVNNINSSLLYQESRFKNKKNMLKL